MSKKKLLFVNESLTLAGGEKSLIALLSNLDPNRYEIDLQLFRYGGALDEMVPGYVKVLPPLSYTTFSSQPLWHNMLSLWKRRNWAYLMARLRYSLSLRNGTYNHPEKAQLYWEATRNVFQVLGEEYDVAIAYAQGVPTFYVVDRVVANHKICWVNVNVRFQPDNRNFNELYYRKYDIIVPVSEVTHNHLSKLFPGISSKLFTIYDIVDYQSIQKMATLRKVSFDTTQFNILTVARLNGLQKGMDITMEVCKILRDRRIAFHWYVIGTGPYKDEMELFLRENELEDYFTFLGTTNNPYPYYKSADLYVQTSRHEGFGISIAEARLLNTPVVTTRFDTVFEQMVHEENGLVVDMNATAVADGIERIMKDKDLYRSIVAYLEQEPKENLESVERFNQLMDRLNG